MRLWLTTFEGTTHEVAIRWAGKKFDNNEVRIETVVNRQGVDPSQTRQSKFDGSMVAHNVRLYTIFRCLVPALNGHIFWFAPSQQFSRFFVGSIIRTSDHN